MIRINKCAHGQKISKLYLCNEGEWKKIRDTNIVHTAYTHWRPSTNLSTYIVHTFSATTSLECSLDEIRDCYTKTVRNEIARAEREKSKVTFYSPDKISIEPAILMRLMNAYSKFCEQEKYSDIVSLMNHDEMLEMAHAGGLYATITVCNAGEIYHIYCCDRINTILLFSFNNVSEGCEDRNAIGRSNKYLHHKDFEYFKSLGVLSYDWGGLFNPDEPNGIDKFKMSFGCKPCKAFDSFIGINIIGKICVIGLKLIKGIKKHVD